MIFTYVNSRNQSKSFLSDKIRCTSGGVHGRHWTPSVTNYYVGERVDHWEKEAVNIELTLTVRGSRAERLKLMDELHDLFEYDIAVNKPGKLYYNDWYCECFVKDSTPFVDEKIPTWLNQAITVYIPSATWYQEETFSITASTAQEDDNAVEYPTLYPFTYPIVTENTVSFENDHFDSCDFVIRAYGPATGFDVSIAGNSYKINHTVEDGEVLTIDSRNTAAANRRAYITRANGSIVNVYNDRDASSSLFAKIPSGSIDVTYSRGYAIDITLLKGRSEPRWL